MAALAKALPSYAWLTALPQLISRICHVNPEINTVTNHIITHVAEAYPQQVSDEDHLMRCLCSKPAQSPYVLVLVIYGDIAAVYLRA